MSPIRPFNPTEAEYEAVVAVGNAAWPDDPSTVESKKYWDEKRNPKYLHQRFVWEQDGQIVAFGSYEQSEWSYHPDKYWLDVTVHPDYEDGDIPYQFYDYLLAQLYERNPISLGIGTREDKTARMALLKELGFEQVMRYPVSRLDVAAFDHGKFVGAEERVTAQGIKIFTLAELQDIDVGWQEKMWNLDWAVVQDIPSPDPMTKPLFEDYIKGFSHPEFTPETWFIAVDDGLYVGTSFLWISKANKDKIYTGLTGTRREYRRKGLATALKLNAIRFAQNYGAKVIETDNEENNHMYQINMKFGFKPVPAWLDFKKVLREEEAEKVGG